MNFSDTVLLERWRVQRDAQAFAEIVARYSGMVYGTCRRILGNATEAEDVAQDCFVTLVETDSKVGSYLGPWLHRVATHRSLNRLKSENRRRERERRFAEQAKHQSELTWDDVQSYVDEAIAELPEKLRQPIVTHFLEGKTQESISKALGLPRTTVTTRIARGTEEIRKSLKRHGVPVAAASLAAMLSANLAEAAPATLTASLGKLALAGTKGSAAAATAGGGFAVVATKVLLGMGAVALVAGLALTGVQRSKGDGPEPAEQVTTAAAFTETANDDKPLSVADLPTDAEEVPSATDTAGPQAATAAAAANAINGVVVDADGQPVPSAEVGIGEQNRLEVTATGLSTDENGRFEIPGLEEGSYTVFAFKSRVGLGHALDLAVGDSDVVIALEPLGSINGRVYDKNTGEPIEGLSIQLPRMAFKDELITGATYCIESLDDEKQQRTDANGHYRFDDVPPAKWRFDFFGVQSDYVLPGYEGPPVYVTLAMGENRTDVDLALERGGAISGNVFGPNDEPLANAVVEISSSKHMYFSDTSLRCDEEGRYRFAGLATGASYTVFAKHEGLALAESRRIDMIAAEEVTGVDIQLTTGHAVYGWLVDDEGIPIGGAEMALGGGRDARAQTDTDGSFEFYHVGPGNHGFSLFDIDRNVYDYNRFVNMKSSRFTMPADRDVRDLLVVMPRKAEGFISGRVTNEAGEPVEGVRVDARSLAVAGGAITVQDGTYRVDGLGAGTTFVVDVYPDEYAWARLYSVAVNSTHVDFVLSRYGSIRGRVVDAISGEPVNRFEVRHVEFRECPAGECEHEDGWQPVASQDGTFRLEEVAPPAARLEVRAEGYAPAKTERFEVRPEETVEDIEVRLSKGAAIEGVVVDAGTGDPFPGVRVRAYASKRGSPRFHTLLLQDKDDVGLLPLSTCLLTMSDRKGKFHFDRLTPGDAVNLVAWREGYGTRIVPGVVVVDGEPTEITMPMAPEGRVVATVYDGDQPAPGISLEFEHYDFEPRHSMYRDWGRTDDAGRTELSGLSGGNYKVTFRVSDRRPLGVFWVDVAEGQTTELEVDLADFATQFGSILGTLSGTQSYENVWVSVFSTSDPSDYYGSVSCDAEGNFELPGLPPGEYVVGAYLPSAEGRIQIKQTVTVNAGEHQQLNLVLE